MMNDLGLEKDGTEEYGHFNNNRKGHKTFLKWLKRRVSSLERVRAVMEATHIYWEDLAEYLHEQGVIVCVVNPAAIKGFAQSQLKRHKTDKLDSRVIAQ